MVDKLKGGKADNKTLEQIAQKHSVDISSIEEQFEKGLKVESEHTTDKEEQSEIVKDHLMQDAQYYDK